ncbi:hypothetical protein AOL_s00088g56 [Orbilia oligospora ATCC 24927]|uniref:Nitrogen regulatory protein areA GATA-like domain-containing protein n=1 Tax=Arthrobotrys oligospora (strain ATCC 24927 / CBS 115.81 / DSM 1491) TaxID=756982 RepID=G1XHU3_ARTOA|nr:hypothetical protein AOL_s00088g56 [Orbilia oligospora ATCC 24927]EGX47280.1 hypothetical protein AOL_s00088g56 [Orbilia oligospora ATCC 24927]
MAEAQCASTSYDKVYTPQPINSELNFDYLAFPPPNPIYFGGRMASASSPLTNSPRTSVTSISTISSWGSYFETAGNQSSLSPYETEDTFTFPACYDYNPASEKLTFIHLEHSIEAEEDDPPFSPTAADVPIAVTTAADLPVTAIDDIHLLRAEPSRHVDYLSHGWKEEDIWASRRYMVGKREVYDNAARLENASWRTWMKVKRKLRTVSPEKIDWMKDYNFTWLYRPLSTAPERSSFFISPTPECSSALRNHSYHRNTKKTILKKRSMPEALLQRSISSSNQSRQAAASIRSQQSQNHHRLSPLVMPSRAVSGCATYQFVSHAAGSCEGTSETTPAMDSGIQSPLSSQKYIHFNDRVEQCMAIEAKKEDDDMDVNMRFVYQEDNSSDEGGLCLGISSRPKNGGQNSRGSLLEPQTIQKLPSTTLKTEVEPSELKQSTSSNDLSALRFGASSSSLSKSSLGSGTAFAFNKEDEDDPIEWEPKWTNRRNNISLNRNRFGDFDEEYGGFSECPPTPSSGSEGIFGRAVDTVNTARDIAYVFWNVGWASRQYRTDAR